MLRGWHVSWSWGFHDHALDFADTGGEVPSARRPLPPGETAENPPYLLSDRGRNRGQRKDPGAGLPLDIQSESPGERSRARIAIERAVGGGDLNHREPCGCPGRRVAGTVTRAERLLTS